MTSLLSFRKQIPLDTPYFWAFPGTQFNVFVPNNVGVNPNSMVGYFSVATVSTAANFSSATTALLRDMGRQIVSSGRTFRRVQQLYLTTPSGLSNTNWVPSNEGVVGGFSTTDDNDFNCYYVEMAGGSAPVGVVNPIFRYG